MASDSQKFIARNRAPRVQIEYDVELYGSEKKVQLPFVMGVMSDLSGKSRVAVPSVEERSFLEIDVDNFDERMAAMAPRAEFTVPNTLSGEGNLPVDVTFEKMEDFSPAGVAAKIKPLKNLLEARTELSNLMAYMDGKSGAEALIEKLLGSTEALQALAGSSPEDGGSADEVLAALRVNPNAEPPEDVSDDILSSLAANAPAEETVSDQTQNALDSLRASTVPDVPVADESGSVLNNLRSQQPSDAQKREDTSDSIFDDLKTSSPAPDSDKDETEGILASIERADATEVPAGDGSDSVLAELAGQEVVADPEETDDDVLEGLRQVPEQQVAESDSTADILSGLANDQAEETDDEDAGDDVLDALRSGAPEAVMEDDVSEVSDSILGELAANSPEDESDDSTTDVLAELAVGRRQVMEPRDRSADVLAALAQTPIEDQADEADFGALDTLRSDVPEQPEDEDDVSGVLADLAETSDPLIPDNDLDDVLGTLKTSDPTPDPEEDPTDNILGSLSDSTGELDDAAESDLDDLLGDLPEGDAEPESSDDTPLEVDEPLASEELDTSFDDLNSKHDPQAGDDSSPEETELGSLDTSQVASSTSTDAMEGDPDPNEDAESEAFQLNMGADLGDLLDRSNDDEVVFAQEDPSSNLDDLLGDLDVTDAPDSILSDESNESETEEAEIDLDDLLADPPAVEGESDAGLDDVLADASFAEVDPNVQDASNELSQTDDPLGFLNADDAPGSSDETAEVDDLDDLLGDLDVTGESSSAMSEADGDDEADIDLDDLLGETNEDTSFESDEDGTDLDDLLGDITSAEESSVTDDAQNDASQTDDLLGEIASSEPAAETDDLSGSDDLDDLLGGLLDDPQEGPADAVAADLDTDEEFNLDDILEETVAATDAQEDVGQIKPPNEMATSSAEISIASGVLSDARPDAEGLNRRIFRIALFGDFTGRSASGRVETGEALAKRRAIPLDVDEIEDIIEGFATTLQLPLGDGGQSIEIRLNELDDLHPDELFENVALFADLGALRQRLDVPSMADGALSELSRWGEAHAIPLTWPSRSSSATAVPADRKLSDFQALIGDTENRLGVPSPIQDLMERVVGPHVVAAPGADAAAMKAALDESLSSAMRLILHHPEFQAIESQWRSLDLLARSIETDQKLQITLFDVSAEEIAADLTDGDDLSQSGLLRLLTEEQLGEDGQGGFSALFGMYQFEETPPHADLLARIARVAAHVDAPFITSISPGFLDTAKEDRHTLVAEAWDRLRSMPEARHLGIASPRFMLRHPYGARSEPCDCFDFEEFTMREGLQGLLWANPVVLVAILMAKSFKMNGPSLNLGSVMSLGGMPYHVVDDRHGDQVALPCTERNLTTSKMELAVTRGFMPLLSIKGRDEVRLGSFQSVAGEEIFGPWSDVPPPPPKPEPVQEAAPKADELLDVGTGEEKDGDVDLDDLLGDLDTGDDSGSNESVDDDLDALLAGFSDDADDNSDDDGDMDAELAALLEDL